MNQRTTLKPVDAVAQQHSEQLVSQIKQAIVAADGFISFERYMQMCLYTPALGYYSAGSHKLGEGGDFTTAPEISSLFGHTLARHISIVFEQLKQKNILEFGAGTGKMAADLLTQLTHDAVQFDHYYIIETSAELKQRQQRLLQQTIPELLNRIHWLEQLPDQFEGVMIANEVCDAMPVHLLHFDNGNVNELGVGIQQDEFCWLEKKVSDDLLLSIANKINDVISHISYQTEINLNAAAWLQTLAKTLQRGAVFIIDYGYSFTDYYQPERTEGTLRCFYQQQAHDNPFILQGLQDITAHVDFTLLAETAFNSGLDVTAFHSQADFLLAGGITELAQQMAENLSTEQWLQQSARLKQLLLPGQMGEQFKALSLTKNLELLPHLSINDRRYLL